MQEKSIGKLSFEIQSYHVDFKHELMIPSLLCFMQEVAGVHAGSYGYGWNDLIKNDLFWVLAKMKIRIVRLPKWEEKIEIHTWGKEPELVTAFRDFEIFDEAQNRIISATSAWYLINTTRYRPQRLDAIREHFPIPEGKHAIEEKPAKVARKDSFDKQYMNTVLFSDIDMNLHVNNTRYAQWALDAFDIDFHRGHHLKEILINYTSQARYGEAYCVNLLETAEHNFTNIILSQEDNREICGIETRWESA